MHQEPCEIGWQAYKIGYERLAGRLIGGMDTWLSAGRPHSKLTFATADRLPGRPYLDVRQAAEFQNGHVAGAIHIELGELHGRIHDVPAGAVIGCGHGERAMTAASLLARLGNHDVAVLDGGPDDYAAAHRRPLLIGRDADR